MSWRGFFTAIERASRLHSCGSCGHTWYAHRHSTNPKCPRCGNGGKRKREPELVAQPPKPSSGNGLAIVAIVIAGIAGAGVLSASAGALAGPSAAFPVALLGWGVTGWGVVAFLRAKRAREAREAEDRRRQAQEWLDEKRRNLIARFGERDGALVLAGRAWQGATAAMIVEMYGNPDEVSRKVYKTKTAETWKYGPLPRNKYRLRVMIENGVCVGWEEA